VMGCETEKMVQWFDGEIVKISHIRSCAAVPAEDGMSYTIPEGEFCNCPGTMPTKRHVRPKPTPSSIWEL